MIGSHPDESGAESERAADARSGDLATLARGGALTIVGIVVNAFASFEQAWLRETDGSWRALGSWELGDSMPEGRAGEPPGWLVPALPMGTSIFLGRIGASELPSAFGADRGPPTWLRGLGL